MAELAALAATWAASLTAYQVISAALVAYSIYDAQKQAKKIRRGGMDTSYKERTLTVRSSDMPQTMVYGKARVGGQFTYGCTHGDRKQFFSFVIALAGHECEAIEDIWFDEQSIGPLNPDGTIATIGSKWARQFWEQGTKQVAYTGPGQIVVMPGFSGENNDILSVMGHTNAGNDEGGIQPVHLAEGTQWSMPDGTFDLTIHNAGAIPVGGLITITYRQKYQQSLVKIKKFLGIPAGERDLDLEAASEGEWTLDHLGKNICRLHVTLEHREGYFDAGLPNISAILKGKKVKNWQTGVVAWSDNAASCTADYLTSPMGFDMDPARVHTVLAQTAEGICLESVPIDGTTGTESRYTCNGAMDASTDKYENLRKLLSSMAGSCTFSAGKAFIRAGAFVTPNYTLEDKDLAPGARTLDPHTPRRDLINGVKAIFADPAQYYASNTIPPYISPVYVQQDGGKELVKEFQLDMTNSARRGVRLAKLALYKARQPLIFTSTWKMAAYPLLPGDTFYCKLKRYGWDTLNGGLGKILEVVDRSLSSAGRVTLTVQETAASIYAWDYSEFTNPDPTPNTSFPDPTYVAPLTGLAAFSDANTVYTLGDGTRLGYVVVSWNDILDVGVERAGSVEVYWKRATSTAYQKVVVRPGADGLVRSVRLEGVTKGEVLNIMARAVNGAGVASDYTFITHTASSALPATGARFGTGNRVQNSNFDTGVQGWSNSFSSADTVSLRLPDSGDRVPGVPSNAAIMQFGAAVLSGFAWPGYISVEPGKRYSAMASLMPISCIGYIGMEFLDASNVSIDVINSATSVGAMTLSQRSEDYQQRFVTGIAPAGAVKARLRVVKGSTISPATTSRMLFMYPWIGEVGLMETTAPKWTPGQGLELVLAGNLVPNSDFQFGGPQIAIDWLAFGADGHNGTVTLDKDNSVKGVKGIPGSVQTLLSTVQSTGTAAKIHIQTREIAVEPGAWYAGYAYVQGEGCWTATQIHFMDAAGAIVQYSAAAFGAAPSVMPDNPVPGNFYQSGQIAVAPNTAKKAVLVVLGYNYTAINPKVRYTMPMLGKVPPGSGTMPLWNNGSQGTLGMDLIAPGSAGRFVQGTWSGPKGNATSVVDLVFTLVATADVQLTYAGTPQTTGTQTGGLGPASPSGIIFTTGIKLVLTQVSPTAVEYETRFGMAEILYSGEPPDIHPFNVRKATSINGEYKLSSLPAGTYTFRLTMYQTYVDPDVTQGTKTYSAQAWVRDTHLTALINYR